MTVAAAANVADVSALTTADAIAGALTEPETAWRAIPPGTGRAWPQSLAGGAAGIAVLHTERARCGRGDWHTARRWIEHAAAGELTAAANAGLYLGAPALAFVTHIAAQGTGGLRQAQSTLDEATIGVSRARLSAAHARLKRGDRPAMKEFDLIRGLAGLGAYHLRSHPGHPVTRDVLAYLVHLTEPAAEAPLPPWWTDASPNGETSPEFPGGHGNFGLAHGIGAVLALLSLAILAEVPVAGTAAAAQRVCGWTDRWFQLDPVPWWPGFITLDQIRDERVNASLQPRPSWCYGIAGMARTQQLAGIALRDPARQHTAEHAMLATLRDPTLRARLPEAGLCHGIAGLLQSAWRMSQDALSPAIGAELPALAAHLANTVGDPLRNPELLDGSAGAALALHAVGTGAVATGWDRFLLMA